MNCILPAPGFLAGLREICDEYGSVLIFDEVMTGFRVALGGAQAYYNIVPDLTTLGKIIGGGMPVGAFGGREEIMRCISPLGKVYQAGTLSGNPVAMTAGLKTLELIAADPDFHKKLNANLQLLLRGLEERARAHNIPFLTTSMCGMFGLYFTEAKSIQTFADVKKCNLAHFQKFFHVMLEHGVYLAPSMYEAGFISCAHNEKEIAKTLAAAEHAFAALAEVEVTA